MNYIVFDLEWNQSAEGKECSVEHMPFEIIEIGAVKLNRQMKQISEFHRLVRPKAYKEMHFKISEVTHMDMEELSRKGQPFPVVMEDFLNWCGEDEYIFCIWGSMDLTELQRNMTYHGMEIPFPRPLLYYDVQKLYSLEYSDGKSRISLDHAVEQLDLDQETSIPTGLWMMQFIQDGHYAILIWKNMGNIVRSIITGFQNVGAVIS